MANIGLKSFLYGALTETAGVATYDPPEKLAGAIEIKVKINLNETSLPHDDRVDNQISEFKDGAITAGIDNDDDTIFAVLLGKKTTVDSFTPESGTATTVNRITSGSNDVCIPVGFGYITGTMVDGVKKYKVIFYKKVTFKPFAVDSKTKGDKLEFTTPSVEGTIATLANGEYEDKATLENESDAIEYLKSLFVASV